LDQPHTVGEVRQQPAPRSHREPRLADAAGAGQGDQPVRAAKGQDLAENLIAAHQLGNRLRRFVGGDSPGVPPSGPASRKSGSAAAIALLGSASGPYTVSIS